MLTNVENYIWPFILTFFVLLFAVIFNTLKSSSIFPKPECFVISLCVAALCILSITKYFPQQDTNSQETAVVFQDDATSQDPQELNFFFLLLPYLALAISIFLLLIVKAIALLADGRSSLFRPFYGNKNKVITTGKQNNLKQIKPK